MSLRNMINKSAELIISLIPYKVYHRLYVNLFPYLHDARKRSSSYDYPYFIAKRKGAKERYCIFRYSTPTYGILAAGIQFLFAAGWAEKRGMIPLLDFELGYDFETYQLGSNNLWDAFFKQPVGIKEALGKDWVLVESIHSRGLHFHPFDIRINHKWNDYTLHMGMDNWREYYKKVQSYVTKLWCFQDHILSGFIEACEANIGNGKKVMGVLLREELSAEADRYMVNKKAKKVYEIHPKTVGIVQTIEYIKKYMEDWECEKIFVATQFQDSLDAIQNVFGEKVLFIDRNRRYLEELSHENSVWSQSSREFWKYYSQEEVRNSEYEKAKSYLCEIYILSKCECFLASKCSGAIAALAMNGGNYANFCCLPDINHSDKY